MERDVFLERVRSATTAGTAPLVPPVTGSIAPELDLGDLPGAFVTNLAAVDGVAHLAASEDEAVATVIELADRYGADRFLSWDPAEVPAPRTIAALESSGRPRVTSAVPPEPPDRLAAQLAHIDLVLGVTGATAGLALSGSVVVESGPGRPRLASLVPLVHVALLRRDAIVPSWAHWAAANPEALGHTSNLVVITGPSRTADIEMQLNLGVHGPKHVHVVIVP